jgi:6-phosphogluconolactonase
VTGVETLDSAQAAATRAAEVIAAAVAGGARHIALAGGSTPRAAYQQLGGLVDDWSPVTFWYGDERCVAPDDPDSNHRMVVESLHAPGARIERIEGELGAEDAAARYADRLAGVTLDLALLGLGEDGHTASLFPGNPALDAGGIAVAVHDAPKPPPDRVSLTLETLNRAGRIVLLCPGAGKRDALARVLAGPDRATPASLLTAERRLVLTDTAALAP